MLSREEFLTCFEAPMVELPLDADPPFDFWTYFDAIPSDHFGGFDFSAGEVAKVYTDRSKRFQHVLVRCVDVNVFLVLVLDLVSETVKGHRLLNLDEEYGLSESS